MKLSQNAPLTAPLMVEPLFPSPEEKGLFERIFERIQINSTPSLPVLKLMTHSHRPHCVTVSFFCVSQAHVVKYLSEMVTRWLVPSKRLPLSRFFMAPFRVQGLEGVYMGGEMELSLSNEENMVLALQHFDLLKAELELGLSSPYYAHRIMEMKVLSTDEKRLLVQDRIVQMVRRFPSRFDTDIFALLHHFFLSLNGEYLRSRETKQFSANLTFFYLMRKALISMSEQEQIRRHVCLKVVRRSLHLPFGTSAVLGVLVGVNFLRENEKFGKEHLVKAVQTVNPSLSLVEGSELIDVDPAHHLQLLYLEFEKKGKKTLSYQEMTRLKEHLTYQVQARIEQLHHPLFMPRNEEEVLRHIVTLGRELKFARDVPQVIILFEKQTGHSLHFVVVVAHIVHPEAKTTSEILDELTPIFRLDRSKKVGFLRNKYQKEALVFKVEFSLNDFLREDHSVDLYRARHDVLMRIEQVFGSVRDYNGGIISKQNEAFQALLESLGNEKHHSQFLLENFFHGITPVERRSLVKVEMLRQFFLVFLKIFETPPLYQNRLEVEESIEALFVVVELTAERLKDNVQDGIKRLQLSPHDFLSFSHERDERIILGYLFCGKNIVSRQEILGSIKKELDFDF